MEITITKDGAAQFRQIPEFLFALLNGLVPAASVDDPRVEARLFPLPADEDEESLCEDWSAFVHPDLHATFQAARDTVQADLRGAKACKRGWAMLVPAGQVDAWLSVLTQARLALAELHALTEKELSEELPAVIENPRDHARIQMHFYGIVQEWFVDFAA